MRYKMQLKKVILALCSVATLSMIGCNNGSDRTGGNENEGNENIIKVKMNNDTVMDKGSVSQLQTNSDGSITYNASAKYSGGGYIFYIKEDKSVINLENYESIEVEFDYETVEGKWNSSAKNPQWCLNLVAEGGNFWNGATTLKYFGSNNKSGTQIYKYTIDSSNTGNFVGICIKLNTYKSGNDESDECKMTIKSIKLTKKSGAVDKPEDDGLTDEQRGEVIKISYASKDYENGGTEATQKPAYVYLPAGFDKSDTSKKYPVLYLMHGVGGNESEWGMTNNSSRIKKYLDKKIAEGEVKPFIVVTPNGRSNKNFTNCDFSNHKAFYSFGSELRNDLIPYIEKEFNASTDRNDRAMAGLSMGGMQTINIGINECLDIISWFGAFSAAPTSLEASETAAKIKEKFADYEVNYFYNICGTEDGTALASATAATKNLTTLCDKFVEGKNFEWVTKPGGHDFNIWYDGFENFAKIVFNK